MIEKKRAHPFVSLVASLLLAGNAAALAVQSDDPQELVRQTADKVLADVTANREQLKADPKQILTLVEVTIAPHFDFRTMTQLALGRFWRQASDEQKTRLSREFRDLLVRTYGSALLSYSGEQIQYLPVFDQTRANRVTIPTRISQQGAPPIPVNYRLHRESGDWQVYDVVIDGISLVTNYRSSFSSEVRRGGIDGLIETLAQRNKKFIDG
jgi:phospholipid transport system substrate-binding protein